MSKLYIEAGANDGVFQSRTLQYRDDPEWHGILIEPDPRCIPDLRANRHNYRTSIVEGALIPFNYPKTSATLNLHHASAMSMIDAATPAAGESYQQGVQVKAFTLSEVLEWFGHTIIDELYLDVEGYELQVMQGINPSEVTIHFAEIECHHHKGPNAQKEVDDHVARMAEFGMELTRVDTDSGHPKLIFQLKTQETNIE